MLSSQLINWLLNQLPVKLCIYIQKYSICSPAEPSLNFRSPHMKQLRELLIPLPLGWVAWLSTSSRYPLQVIHLVRGKQCWIMLNNVVQCWMLKSVISLVFRESTTGCWSPDNHNTINSSSQSNDEYSFSSVSLENDHVYKIPIALVPSQTAYLQSVSLRLAAFPKDYPRFNTGDPTASRLIFYISVMLDIFRSIHVSKIVFKFTN